MVSKLLFNVPLESYVAADLEVCLLGERMLLAINPLLSPSHVEIRLLCTCWAALY